MRDHVFISDRLCRSPPLSLSLAPLTGTRGKTGNVQTAAEYASRSQAALDTHALDLTDYALTAILTVQTVALGQLFVGTFSSNVFRLAYELAVADGGVGAGAACSLDVLWHASP